MSAPRLAASLAALRRQAPGAPIGWLPSTPKRLALAQPGPDRPAGHARIRFGAWALAIWLLCGAALAGAEVEAIPHPALEGLETSVAEQLAASRELLATATPGELASAYGELGQAYHAYGFLAAAAACYRNAESLAPVNPIWPYAVGEVERQLAHHEQALAAYRRALELDPEAVPALVHLAETEVAAGNPAAAGVLLNRALALAPEQAAVRAAIGQAALSRDDFAGAAEAFEAGLELEPEANRLHYPLALAYRGLGDSVRAQRHFESSGAVGARLRDPLQDELDALKRGERVHIARGRTAFRAGRYADAAAQFRAAIVAVPDSIPARVNLGSALALAGDLAGAVEQFRAVLQLAPQNFTAHFNLGLLAHQAGQPDAAITHLQAASALAPADAEARLALALALESAPDPERALAAYAEARVLAPDREDLWLNPAQLLRRHGRDGDAETLLRAGLARLPHSAALQEALASPPARR